MRKYELVFIMDPRLSDDEAGALSEEYREMLTAAGAEVAREESWGRRKLAYPIEKLSEGRYVLFAVEAEEGNNPFPEIEQRMQQNEKVLRYLTVRMDAGRLRVRGAQETAAVAVEETVAEEAVPAKAAEKKVAENGEAN
jgi:small subunit ribosomal protein S6